ncbi:unnamed protein product [Caenorhabditis brenneri]
MRIVFIALFLLVAELHSRSMDVEEWLKKELEEEDLDSGGKHNFPRLWTPYQDPKPVLNDSVFATVEEYPDGYTGYLCTKEGNIRYTLEPCSQHVWECSNGKLFKKTCAGSSVFWFEEGTCDSTASQESTCNRKKKYVRGWSWPPAFIHIAKVRNVTELNSLAPGSSPTLITIDCRKYALALFAFKQCHPEYIRCHEGVRFLHTCPQNTLFCERHQYCVPRATCGTPTPNWFRRMEPVLIVETPENAKYYRNLTSPTILITIDCMKKIDRDYEIGKCHPSYIICMDGARTMISCLAGQVYHWYYGCVDLNECEEAWHKVATTTLAPIVEEEEEKELPWYRQDQMILVPTVEACVGKMTRRYAMSPCQAEYMYCFRGSGYKLKCSDGFVLSRLHLSCVGKEFCDE